MKRIIYLTDEGGIAVIIPAPEYLETHTIEELAAKDVPAGVPYRIVDATDIPEDRFFRGAWEFDIAEPDEVSAESNEFPEEV
jgi:hypothetical protein